MEDILKNRIKESVGKVIKIILFSNYIYSGKIINVDDRFVEILDFKTSSYHVFDFENIKDLEVRE